MWHTEGKGDEDMAVVEFRRRDAEDGRLYNVARPVRFSATLPNSPLSYDGRIVKVRWCVRVRVFLHRGKDVVGEKEFRLGDVQQPANFQAKEQGAGPAHEEPKQRSRERS